MAHSSLFFDRWPRYITRHPWRVLLGALVFLIALGGASAAAGGSFVDQFSVPGTETQRAIDLLRSRFPQQAGGSAELVIRAPAGLRSPAVRARIDGLITEIQRLPDVVAVSSPYAASGAISRDGTIARMSIQYDRQAPDLSKSSSRALHDFQVRVSAPPAFQVEVGGEVIEAADQGSLGNSELYGVLAAVVILLFAFGSVVAMGLPIVTALVGLGGGVLAITMLAAFVHLPSFTTAFAAMIGLGVGIDYALLIVTRFRQALHRGLGVADAVEEAMTTAGRTVVFAGATVVVAMLGLWTVGIPFISYLGTSAAIVVAFAVLVANSILPALLALIGRRIDALRIPGISVVELEGGFGRRLGALSRRAPAPVAIVSVAVIAAIALPFFSLNLGSSDAGSNPTSSTTGEPTTC